MSKFVPIGFRVHVQPDQTETEKKANAAGIALPEFHQDIKSARVAVDTGTVVGIGPTAWADYGGEAWVAVGDRVVYARHAGYAVGEGVDKILVLNDGDIVTKLETEDV